MFILANNDKQQTDIYNILESVCERNHDKINCLEILPKYESFKGAHGYFQVQDTNSSVIGLVR